MKPAARAPIFIPTPTPDHPLLAARLLREESRTTEENWMGREGHKMSRREWRGKDEGRMRENRKS